MLTLRKLLSNGYFPTRLPPPFTTAEFAKKFGIKSEVASIQAKFSRCPQTRAANHNQARPGSLRRKLAIPNPINFWLLADFVVQNQAAILPPAAGSPISLSKPDVTSPNRRRAIERSSDFDDLPGQRSHIRSRAAYILKADVSRFYHSIYTHSISWALHTKAVAKVTRRRGALLGNQIDGLLRDMQDGQTVGIPIGPDTSFLIAELILSKVDQTLFSRARLRGIRYIDDYEFAFGTRAEAEEALALLQEALNEYELALNPSKTSIGRLPQPADSLAISELRCFRFRRSGHGQKWDLVRFVDRAFFLAGEFPDEAILTYAVRKTGGENIKKENWQLHQDFLLHCAINEPGSLEAVLQQLSRYRAAGFPVSVPEITETVNLLIQRHAPLGHGSEVAWSVWTAIVLDCPLQAATASAAASMTDSAVALLLLHAHAKGLIPGSQFAAQLIPFMTAQDLRSEMWLLVYEANFKGWLPFRGADFVARDRFFRHLKHEKVSFYNTRAAGAEIKEPEEPEEGIISDYF